VVVYWLFRLTIAIMRPLPLWLGYRIAAAVAEVCYHFFGRQRRALNQNLAWVLQTADAEDVDAVARRAFRNFGKFVVDFIHFPVMTADEVRQRTRFAQWHELDDAQAAGRGVLIVTMHFGIWDLGAAALAAYGYPTSAIADTFGHPGMNDLIHGSREKLGMKIIQRDRAAAGILRTLRRGDFLCMLIDVPAPGQTVVVDFLGAPAEVSDVPARIALRTGAAVIPSMVLRGPERDTTIRPVVDTQSIRYEPTGDERRDVQELTQRIMRSLEEQVRRHPEQWYIFRPVWPEAPAAPQAAALEL
jgi:KDO2-lipid IV(A) lauroyltransferase